MILGLVIAAPFALIVLWPYAPLAALAILLSSHVLLMYAVVRPNVQWFGPVVTKFSTDRKELWLTIDDGPTADTRAVLDLFDARAVKATFFVKGMLAEQDAAAIDEILRRGHSVANHTQTHPSGSFWCSLPGRIATEIDDCNRALKNITGTQPRWFRAPVGMKNPAVHPALARRGMRLIGWSARAFDAIRSDPDEILLSLLPNIEPGAIIVLHQGRAHSVRALDRVITELQSRGYAFVIPDDAQLA